jgi:large subunit ribosomal protein L21
VYAVVRTGGKQYRVEEGRAIKVDRLPGEPGDTIELGDVLLMGDGEDVTLGAPTIAGARVVGTIAEQGRASKIVVFRYKAKTRSRKKTGHRQQFTRLIVSDILAAGQEPKPKAAAEPAVAEAPAAEAAAKPRRARRKAEPQETAATEPAAKAEAPEAAQDAAPEAASKQRRSRKKTE